MLGSTIAHYEILEKIGEGGMGEVYRARDTHLDRFVAIKVLPPGRADAEHLRRFVQEAKAASALNHPNIVTVHDAAAEGGVDYIVMEYVAGRTLDELVRRKPLRVNEALGYAVQIAEALGRAHSAGIVHRDLKPSNIMVDDHGLVKILDFGLAKLTQPEPVPDAATATLQPRTDDGMVVGTAPYMSPEQAEGRRVDSRTDVFSFGLVLYEMLTGVNPFRRDSRISTLAAVVTEDPKPPTGLAPSLTPDIDRAVMRCLRKDPQRRWQSMSDLKSVLEDLKENSESGRSLAAAIPPVLAGRRRALLWGSAVLLVLAAAVLAGWLVVGRRGEAPRYQVARVTFDSGVTMGPTISRDGKLIAYASDRSGEEKLDIWVRYLDRTEPVRRTHDPVGAGMPSISPDGSRIVFRSERDGGGLYVTETLGGDERRLTSDDGAYPRFSPDGRWILYTRRAPTSDWADFKMFVIPSQGGEPRAFLPEYGAVLGRGGIGPLWSPDSRFILFAGVRSGSREQEWVVAPVEGGSPVVMNRSKIAGASILSYPSAWPSQDTLLVAEGVTIEGLNLHLLKISPRTFQVTGGLEPITSGPGLRVDSCASAEGTILFDIVNWVTRIASVPLDSSTGQSSGEMQIVSADSATKLNAAASLDGTMLAWSCVAGFTTGRRFEARVRDLRSGRESLISDSSGILDKYPRLSPDGALVSYRDTVQGVVEGLVAPAEGGTPRRVCRECLIADFFPGNADVLVSYAGRRLARQRIAGGEPVTFIEPKGGVLRDPRVAPDGKRVAFTFWRADGGVAICTAPVLDRIVPEQEWTVIAESRSYALSEPNWGAGGDAVYYASEQDGGFCLWARKLDRRSGRPQGESFAAMHFHNPRRALAGRRASSGITIARDRAFFIVAETSSDLWMLKLAKP